MTNPDRAALNTDLAERLRAAPITRISLDGVPQGGPLRQAMLERYPKGVLPRGVQSKLAREFGVTRQRSEQIMTSLGFQVCVERRPSKRALANGLCAYCEIRIATKNQHWCSTCIWIELPCNTCGKTVKRRRAMYDHRMTKGNITRELKGQALYSGKIYCNRTCSGKALAKQFGWGSPHQKQRHSTRTAVETRRRGRN